jgi:hypothetical protein
MIILLQKYLLAAEGCLGNQGHTLETVGLGWMKKEEVGDHARRCSFSAARNTCDRECNQEICRYSRCAGRIIGLLWLWLCVTGSTVFY